ncbi:MAG TPA: MFS transporter, partial [Verrucomicrobiota bacterium]|nr:MFS transporter [Verrucomicrobiota bacterium]
NYIPLVFPVHLRGTGESFAANIGGRVIGTAAAWITITLSAAKPPDPVKIALVGAAVAGAYALIGAILTRWLPEPKPGAVEE